jgi:hypothetical protein
MTKKARATMAFGPRRPRGRAPRPDRALGIVRCRAALVAARLHRRLAEIEIGLAVDLDNAAFAHGQIAQQPGAVGGGIAGEVDRLDHLEVRVCARIMVELLARAAPHAGEGHHALLELAAVGAGG